MKPGGAWKWWVGIGLALGTFIYLVQPILLPFVVGILTAYFLDPAADRLERAGLSRLCATVVITVTFFSTLLLGAVAVFPLLAHQAAGLFADLPAYAAQLEAQYRPAVERTLGQLPPQQVDSIREALNKASGAMLEGAGNFLTRLFYSGFALLNLLSLFLITPIVAFYLLRDWDRIVGHLDALLPLKHAPTIRAQVREIDRTLAGFLRGQLNVCLLMGLFYGIGLSLTGLKFGFIIGLMTGLLVILPYVGFALGLLVGMGIALVQFDGALPIGVVFGVFMLGQLIESNFITPKLVGDKVGLHPLWIIFGMLAGAALFGAVGVLLAVPLTAVIGVLIRFWVQLYRNSPLYRGAPSNTP